MYRHLLIPTDGSELSAYAIDQGLELASRLGARVTFFTTIEPFPVIAMAADPLMYTRDDYRRETSEAAQRHHADAVARAQALGVDSRSVIVEHGHPDEAIVEAAAQHGCDLIAMASHGRRGMQAVLLGSVTLKVLTRAALPVLVYRRP
ncbi:universal stress protein [Luteimonas huabeiensis]|uniref:universal stress protein n=1 Tax=Luteimonas huabeiensis TaxID=1244513 RepID=UPI000463CA75|nr:universal stress protein [Luteimonas huabeiensis]